MTDTSIGGTDYVGEVWEGYWADAPPPAPPENGATGRQGAREDDAGRDAASSARRRS